MSVRKRDESYEPAAQKLKRSRSASAEEPDGLLFAGGDSSCHRGWRRGQACAVWAVHKTRAVSRMETMQHGTRAYLKAKNMMKLCRSKLNELTQARWRAALRNRKIAEFNRDWIHTGAAFVDLR